VCKWKVYSLEAAEKKQSCSQALTDELMELTKMVIVAACADMAKRLERIKGAVTQNQNLN